MSRTWSVGLFVLAMYTILVLFAGFLWVQLAVKSIAPQPVSENLMVLEQVVLLTGEPRNFLRIRVVLEVQDAEGLREESQELGAILEKFAQGTKATDWQTTEVKVALKQQLVKLFEAKLNQPVKVYWSELVIT